MKLPTNETITVTGKPGTAQASKYYEYKDYTKTWLNHCPLCGKDGTLSDNPKGVPEHEITCDKSKGGCDADYDVCTGGDKLSNPRAYLQDANGRSNTKDSVDTSIGDGEGNATPTAGATAGSTSGGGQIKDKTFEDCIRRICAGTDSVFIVENNCAILFPYTDWLNFTLQSKLQKIEAKDIDPDVFSFEYNNTGTYNKVTATWGNISDTHQESSETVTEGKHTTKTEKNNPNGTVTISKQHDSLVRKYGVLEKIVDLKVPDKDTAEYLVDSLLVEYVREFNSSCKVRAINNKKYIGGTFYDVYNKFENESQRLYLNGYTMRMQQNEPLYFDLDLRYGPEGAEDIMDYQNFVGTGSGGTLNAGGPGQTMGSDAIEVGNNLAKLYGFCNKSGSESYGAMQSKGCGSCWAWSGALWTELHKIGYTVRVVNYATSMSSNHRSVQYKDESGQWQDYPYRDTNIPKLAYSTSGSTNGTVVVDENGKGSGADILS